MPILVGSVGKQLLLGDARIADKHLQTAQGFFGLGHSGAHLGGVARVSADGQKRPGRGEGAGLGGYGLGGFGVCMIGKGHVVARAGQRQHSRRANAPAAAGQKHVTHHFFFLFSRSIAKKSCKSACASSSSNPDSITG